MIGWVDAAGDLVRVSAPNEPVPECNGLTPIDVPGGFMTGALEWDPASKSFVAPDDLDRRKSTLRMGTSRFAENVRNRFLTPGSGQAITYVRKEGEARNWAPGSDPATAPFLAAEAAATGVSIDALAETVRQMADAWVQVGAAIEARRRALLVAIDAATTRAELDGIDITDGWPEGAA